MKNDTITLEVTGLDQLLKALKAKPPVARVGVLGSETMRPTNGKSAPTNAEILAAHEYGVPSRGLPQRSVLRVPLADNFQKVLESSGAISKAEFKEVLKSGTVTPWVKKIAALAVGIVKGGFSTGGYGKWPAWKDPNYTNNTGQILVDTTSLRDSITSEVKE